MPLCTKCKSETDRVLACVHTDEQEVCIECYQQIHWLLTEG